MNPLMEGALEYAAQGIHVFPLHSAVDGICSCQSGPDCGRSAGKHPRMTGWQKEATTDKEKIRQWWSRWPKSNIGIACGREPTPIWVFDVDGETGLKTLAELEGEFGDDWAPARVKTRSGGLHLYFAGGMDLANSTKGLPGCDTRALGGLVVAPPSPGYEWLGVKPSAFPAIPEWLPRRLADVAAKKRTVQPAPVATITGDEIVRRARAYLAKIPPAVEGAGGSNQTFWAACQIGPGFDLPTATARQLLEEYSAKCEPPWSAKELDHKIEDAYKRETRRGWLSVKPLREASVELGDSPGPKPVLGLTRSYGSAVKIARDKETRELVLGPGDLWCNSMTGQFMLGDRDLPENAPSLFREGCEAHLTCSDNGHPIRFARSDCQDALFQVAGERQRMPLQEYLGGLQWDGVKRLDTVLPQSLGVEVGSLEALLLRRWAISAIARAMSPGCKVDTVLVLVGPQGAMKSSWFRVLAGDKWFLDTQVRLDDKDAKLTMRKAWVLEWAELDSMRGRAQEATKAFLSSQVDVYRPPYARGLIEAPRHCVVVGTTNNAQFLSDDTGNRRFWPITVTSVDLEAIRSVRDQLWAEALGAWRGGEQWWLERKHEPHLGEAQDRYRQDDEPWSELVTGYHMVHQKGRYSTAELLEHAIKKPCGQWTRADEMRVGRVLRNMGWERRKERMNGAPTWIYSEK